MKKIILLLMLCVAGIGMARAKVVRGECGADGDNVTWSLNTNTGILIISGTGEMGVSVYNAWNDYKDIITEAKISNGVTNIYPHTFSNCTNLTNVEISNSVTNIGYSAFAFCTSLTSIEIPNSVTEIGDGAFLGCTSLTSIEIPSSVTTIGTNAFQDCTGLTSVEIPNSVTDFGSGIFSGCSNLVNTIYNDSSFIYLPPSYSGSSYTIPNGIRRIVASAFYECTSLTSIGIPNSVTEIGSYAFGGCTSLTSMEIPNSVTDFGDFIFDGCSNLIDPIYNNSSFIYLPPSYSGSSYTIPNGIRRIVASAFYECTSLTSIEIPSSVTTIGAYAFQDCTGLTNVEIPSSVKTIGAYAFQDCTGLMSIEIPNSVTEIGSYAFGGCTSLTSIDIPNSVTEIGSYAFNGCTGLTSVELPNSVTTIGDSAFGGCTSLTSVDLPSSVTEIGNGAFLGCTSLTSIEIPSSVTTIGASAFQDCTGLTSVDLPSSVTEIGNSAFNGCTGLTSIDVPSSVTYIGDYAFPCIVNVSPDNLNYASINGVLFDKGMTEMICCGYNVKHIVIPAAFTELLGRMCFAHCDNLEEMTINTKVFPSIWSSAGFASLFKQSMRMGTSNGYKYEYMFPTSFKKLTLNIDSLDLGVFAKEIEYDDDIYTYNISTIDTVIIKARKLTSISSVYNLEDAFPSATHIEIVWTGTTTLPNLFEDGNVKKFEAPNATTVGSGRISGLSGLEELSLPKAQTIAPDALSGLVSLKSLTLPFPGAGTPLSVSNFGELFGSDSHGQMRPVTQVMMDGEQETYYLPSGLDSLTIVEGCGEIPYGCFYGCTMLKRVVLPSSLYSVGERAFYGCAGMTDIWCRGADPAVAYDNSFDGMRLTSCKLHVPYDTSEMYARAAGWERFYYIEEEAPLKISVVKNIENAGVIYGLNEYQYGDTAELRAVANSSYTFSGWTEGGTLLTIESTLSFIVEASRSLTAVFAPVSGDNEVEASPSGGSVTFTWDTEEGADSYVLDVYADEAMTELVGTTTFDSDGNVVTRTRAESRKLAATIGGLEAATEYFWQMTVLGDAGVVLSQYTGEFVTTVSGLDDTLGGTIGCHGGRGVIVVSGAEGRRVTVFDTAGTVLWSSVMASDREALPSAPGLRIVDIDGSTFKVVVR